MRKLILLVVLIFTVGCIGCRTEKGDMAALSVEPTVTEWFPNDTFVVIREVKRVDGLEMGQVIIRRQERSALFSAIVVPYREIPVGTKVKVIAVAYQYRGFTSQLGGNLLVVR